MNKVLIALAVPLVFSAFGCSKTEVDPAKPVAVAPRPQAPQASNTAPTTTPLPQDNSSSASSSAPSQGNELNTQSQGPSASTDAQTSQKN